jgi:hypothetical protein
MLSFFLKEDEMLLPRSIILVAESDVSKHIYILVRLFTRFSDTYYGLEGKKILKEDQWFLAICMHGSPCHLFFLFLPIAW